MEGTAGAARLPEADVIKAAGISVIPLIHSLRALWDGNVSSLERWLLFATRFAVPGFLFTSGYLLAGERLSAPRMGTRLRRLLVPYAIATSVAELFFFLHGHPVTAESVALDFVFGSALGPYYYVFVAVLLLLAWPLFAIAKPPALALLAAASVACQVSVELGLLRLPIPWIIRNPVLWCAYFLSGWALRRERARVLEWLEPRRRIVTTSLVATALSALVFTAFFPPGPAVYLVAWGDVYVTIALLYVASTGLRDVPWPVRRLSDASYAVYLYHLIVIYLFSDPDRGAPAASGAAHAVTAWLLGLGAPIFVAALLRRALGARARLLFGG